jgi:serine/threonine protein phosphatase PrpC/LysM repeat protein
MAKEENLTIKYKSVSLLGSKKKHNQDAFAEFLVPGGFGFAICDGINGKEGGAAIASKMAIESIKKQFRNSQFNNPQKALTNALTLANFQLFDHIQKNDRFKGMGASCGVVLVINNLVYYAYIGNIRVYFLRDNTIYRLTRDHTIAQTAFVNKKVLEDDLDSHEGYYQPDRALGFSKDVNFSVCKQPISISEDDKILLTSDGLFRELSENQIAEIVDNQDASVDFIADNLARKADEAGGNDNITLTVMNVFNKDKVPYEPEVNEGTEIVRSSKKIPKVVWIVVSLIALVALLFAINEMVFTHETVTQIKEENKKEERKIESKKPEAKDTVKVIPQASNEKVVEKVLKDDVVTPKFLPYKIDKGDNFYRLGIRFNVTVQYLEEVNNVQAKRLRLGQRIRIPVKALHKVSSGENLSLLAQKYQVPVKDIIRANRFDNADNLKEGMEIFIPLQYDDKIGE